MRLAPIVSALVLSWAVAATGIAHAESAKPVEKPKKEQLLDEKKAAHVPTKAERAKLDRELRKRIGKKPSPVLNIWNHWTSEMLVVDDRPKATVSQDSFDNFLRDHFTNQPHVHMDLRLVDILVAAAVHFHSERIDIVSGFRAPKYNLMLRKKGHQVARDSQHTKGDAVDFRIPHVTTKELLSFVRSLRKGGVGYYPESAFVHADTAKIRYWTGL